MGSFTSIVNVVILAFLILPGCQHMETAEEDKLLRVAERMELQGNKKEAIQVYKDLLNKTDKKIPLYTKISDSYLAAGDYKSARAILYEALPMDEQNQIKLRLAKCYLLEGAPDKALPLYQQITQITPHEPQSHNGLGLSYTLQGYDDAAIASYQRAVALEPHNKEYQSNLGLALALKGEYKKSLAILEPLGNREGATAKQRHNLAFAYGLSGDELKARKLFEQNLEDIEVERNLKTIRYIRNSPSHRPTKSERLVERQALEQG